MNHIFSMISAVIGTELFSVIICLILLIGSRMKKNGRSKRTRWFIALVLTDMAGCFCDALSWILDGRAECNAVLFATTLGSMLMTLIMMGIFFSYLSAYISERKTVSNIPVIIEWIAIGIGVAVTSIASFCGDLFSFHNGVFTEETFYPVYVFTNIGYILVGMVIVTAYRKILDRYDKMAAYAYMLIPMSAAIISLFIEDWEFAYPAVTISLLILYIVLQSDRVKKLEEEGSIISYQATHDELTGLNNRSAYRTRLRMIKTEEGSCGVVFGDLNGLKYVNDTIGHEAGNQLLIRYAGILADIFRMHEIYRISGDEFICIMENASEEVFRKRISELEEILNRERPPIACIGTAYGSGKEIDALIRDAENRMYEKKVIIHKCFPETRR